MAGGEQNWRQETDAGDYFLHQKKQLTLADRRPVIRRSSDLVGPGLAANAVRVTDMNDTLATYNGFFSCAIGAANAPTPDEPYVGYVSSDAELGGVQSMTGLLTANIYQRVFTRNPYDATVLYWGDWRVAPTELPGTALIAP